MHLCEHIPNIPWWVLWTEHLFRECVHTVAHHYPRHHS